MRGYQSVYGTVYVCNVMIVAGSYTAGRYVVHMCVVMPWTLSPSH